MKIDFNNLTEEDLEKMLVIFPHLFEGEEEEDDEEEEEEDDSLPIITYEIELYKNSQSQTVANKVEVSGANVHVMPMSELNAALMVLNDKGQAVYVVSWDLVHRVEEKIGKVAVSPTAKAEEA